MVQIINNAFPTINSGSAALGFSFPLSGPAVFNPTYTIKEVVKTNFPTVEVKKVQFDNQQDRNTINFTLDYEVRNIGQTDQLNIELQ